MNKKIIITLIFTFSICILFAQKKEINSIKENELKAHIEFIAGDYMQGRDFGTEIPGLEITAEYLKSECLKMGLKTSFQNYSQPLELVSIKIDKENSYLELKNKKGESTFKSSEIFSFAGNIQNDTISGKIVFAGYGFHNQETGYNDFEGLELKDKIVLVMTRNREMAIDKTKKETNTNLEMSKLGRLFLSGAKAVIFIPDPVNSDHSWIEMAKEYIAQGSWKLKNIQGNSFIGGNIILGNQEIANEILKTEGKTLAEIQEEINNSGKPNSFEIEDTNVKILLSKTSETVNAENIIGFVEGSDEKLKNECIVITAHYDHVGVNSKGEINNGADDNASGTAAMLEIAEAYSLMKKKPRRSIVFAWVTAEEKGLLGSEYYTIHPVFPIEKTVTNINLDMVGRVAETEKSDFPNQEKSLAGFNGVHVISGKQSSELIQMSKDICAELDLIPFDDLSNSFISGSDHFNFYKKGIPVIAFTTGLHEDYHFPGDDVEKINFKKVKRIADLTFLVSYKIANQKNRIVVDNPRNN